jgi:hypothetical protein
LNRAFPGNPAGTLAERIASMIFQKIAETSPAVVLDLHNDWIRSIPYAVLDAPAETGATVAEQKAGALAAESGFLVVTEPNPLRKTLSHSLLREGIPAITIELGESFVVNETNVEFGVQSVFNVLRELGMVSETVPRFQFSLPSNVPDKSLTYSQAPASSTCGLPRAAGYIGQTGATGGEDRQRPRENPRNHLCPPRRHRAGADRFLCRLSRGANHGLRAVLSDGRFPSTFVGP